MDFPEKVLRTINDIFDKAQEEYRNSLYEFEVYQILEQIGLKVPAFVQIQDPAAVDAAALHPFRDKLVVKIVSPDIAHKQKLGGVRIINNLDPLFVQFVLSRMEAEVLSHFPAREKPRIHGFLLTECIPFTQSIGSEILLGFKEDPSFGPVLTLSKGGEDAEFFAKYYDPANLFLPPLDINAALQMVNTLKIRHKLKETGHLEYLDMMAQAVSVLSRLAYHFSFVAPMKPRYCIYALDINPFVFSSDNRFVAVDGYTQFAPYEPDKHRVDSVDTTHLDLFFKPKGIAVIGVSGDLNKYSLGRDIAHLLHDLNRQDMALINPKGGSLTVGDTTYPLYPSLQEVPHPVDLVVYAAPAQFTMDFIKSLPEDGPKAVILISGIPSNIKYSEYAALLDSVKPKNLRIIGPNCMGVYYAPEKDRKGLNTLFIEERRLEIKASELSNTVLLTQSGALAVTALDRLQNSRLFKSVVSFGNKYDVKITDLMAYFAKDPSTKILALYVEGLDAGEGRQFFDLMPEVNKPVIVYKGGRTAAGAKAAASHTASMSGSYDVFKAACRQTGVILAENIEDHYAYVKAFSLLQDRIPTGNRVAGVVNAGFESTVGADELKNLQQAKLQQETISLLNQINRYGLVDTSSPFLDITPMADDAMYADFVEALLADNQVDCVFVAIVPHAVTLKTTPDTCSDRDSLAYRLSELSRKYKKPMVVSVNAGRYYQAFVSLLEEHGLPVYGDIRAAIKSLDTYVSYHTNH